MSSTTEMLTNPNDLSQELIKHWLTELTSYTPQQVDTAIAQMEQLRTQTAQHN
ncbi:MULTISPECIES: hypothetical protein [Acaryochloris]|uniref:Uncharacterized protein n=1 Tax=Acaryochloris marina (strain MBIC 11017) TaxID=329726 RepID=B0C2W3_ACAM1|nr:MULTISPECIES: hypothetical protein [Acaryochloris]ABW26179.1 hypothetical protein AM1_1140 [Acaryochloris marina MBIC11017]KAI9130902.1 hypothetical protein ON05_024635 [Acaryochloris sp. CCMEE 5410]BDM81011.1 hypothetical protein AM10699_38780 [Acaryochloris marina MBIC10699]